MLAFSMQPCPSTVRGDTSFYIMKLNKLAE